MVRRGVDPGLVHLIAARSYNYIHKGINAMQLYSHQPRKVNDILALPKIFNINPGTGRHMTLRSFI